MATLTRKEATIIRLLGAGYARWRVAELVGTSDDDCRATIEELCERYDCRQGQLAAEAAADLQPPVAS